MYIFIKFHPPKLYQAFQLLGLTHFKLLNITCHSLGSKKKTLRVIV